MDAKYCFYFDRLLFVKIPKRDDKNEIQLYIIMIMIIIGGIVLC